MSNFTVYLVASRGKAVTHIEILQGNSLKGIQSYLDNSSWYRDFRHTTSYCVVEEELSKGNTVIYIEEKL